jgi:hypothetical protein
VFLSCQQAAPKNLSRNFFCFIEKTCRVRNFHVYRKQDFSLFLLIVGLIPAHKQTDQQSLAQHIPTCSKQDDY